MTCLFFSFASVARRATGLTAEQVQFRAGPGWSLEADQTWEGVILFEEGVKFRQSVYSCFSSNPNHFLFFLSCSAGIGWVTSSRKALQSISSDFIFFYFPGLVKSIYGKLEIAQQLLLWNLIITVIKSYLSIAVSFLDKDMIQSDQRSTRGRWQVAVCHYLHHSRLMLQPHL